MKSKEYSDTKAIGLLSSAVWCLRDIVPENVDVIDEKEFRDICGKLNSWKEELLNNTNIEQE